MNRRREIERLLQEARQEGALSGLLHEADRQGVVVGMDALVDEVKAKLVTIRDRKNTKIYDEEGKLIRSVRQFARYMGNESTHSWLSQFINNNAIPCFTILDQAARALNIKYVISSEEERINPSDPN